MRFTMRSSVVFPQSDGPTRTVIRSLSAVRSIEPTATVPSGYCLPTCMKEITPSLAALATGSACAGFPSMRRA